MKEAIRAGLDTVEHGTLLDEEAIALMKQHGTYYVPTMVAPFHICAGGTASGIPAYAVQKSNLVMERHKESVRHAHEVGVKIAMGTDCGTPFNVAGKNALELELLTQNGLSTAEALMATTLSPLTPSAFPSIRARSKPASGLTSSWCKGTRSPTSACCSKLSASLVSSSLDGLSRARPPVFQWSWGGKYQRP